MFQLKHRGTMLIKNMKLGWTTVSDIDKTRSFFIDKLGHKETDYNADYGWLEVQAEDEGFTLGLGRKNEENMPYQPGHNVILTMEVDDIVAAKKLLEEKGVAFKTDIYEVPGHVKLVDFVDDDNNVYQLVQTLN